MQLRIPRFTGEEAELEQLYFIKGAQVQEAALQRDGGHMDIEKPLRQGGSAS